MINKNLTKNKIYFDVNNFIMNLFIGKAQWTVNNFYEYFYQLNIIRFLKICGIRRDIKIHRLNYYF